MIAVQNGHLATAEALLNAGAQGNLRDPDKNTALHFAAQQKTALMTDRLIAAGADVSALNKEGATPLCLAVRANTPSVEPLVRAGALTDDATCGGEKYFLCAARSGCTLLLTILIERGVDINVTSETGATALHYAINRGHLDVFNLLLDTGADINKPDQRGWTALHHAVRGNQLEMLRILISHSPDLEIRDDRKNTPLLLAAQLGRTDALEMLARSGANLAAMTTNNQTAEQIAQANQRRDILVFFENYRRELRERRPAARIAF